MYWDKVSIAADRSKCFNGPSKRCSGEFICRVNLVSLQSSNSELVEILKYFNYTVLQASCCVVVRS